MERDDFYQQLPFTLTPEQLNPQFVALGTGLQECLLAAHLSKIESTPGLVIDVAKTYGSALKTVTFKELHQLNTNKTTENLYEFVTPPEFASSNQQFYEWCLDNKKTRGFSIDLEPRLFLADSRACECLKQADMDKYMDFHLVNTLMFPHKNSLRQVPLSKGRIFDSKELSLMEKKLLLGSLHKLAKIYNKWKQLEEDPNSTKEFDKGFGQIDQEIYGQFLSKKNQGFMPFVEKLVKGNKNLINFLTYIVCHYPFRYEKVPPFAKKYYSLGHFVERFGLFIHSCGVYGQSPFLYVDNGIGDIPQAFSRIASIYGSTYVLHPKIIISATISTPNHYQIFTNLSPGKPVTTKQLYLGPSHQNLQAGQQKSYKQTALRMLMICQRINAELVCPALTFIPELEGFLHPIFVHIFDSSTQSCPKDYILYQIDTQLDPPQSSNTQEAHITDPPQLSNTHKAHITEKAHQLRKYLGQLIAGLQTSLKYYSVYLRNHKFTERNSKQLLGDCWSIELDQCFQNFIEVIGPKENYFKKEQVQEEQDNFGGYDTNILLERLQNISLNSQKTEEGPTVDKTQIQRQQPQILNSLIQVGLPQQKPEQQKRSNRQQSLIHEM